MKARAWIAAGVAIAVTLVLALRITESLELPVRDAALQLLPREPARVTAVIAIDEASLKSFGRWPWRRALLAQLVDRAREAGARAIVLDVLLAESDPDDAQLAAAMRRIPTIAVAVLQGGGEWLLPTPALREASMAAHGNFELDHDGILRRFASTKQNADRALTALSAQAAATLRDIPVPVGQSIAPEFRTTPRAIPIVSAADVIAGAPLPQLRGRVVFIGATAMALSDRVLTPVSDRLPDAGVTIHAAATESLVRGETVRELPPIVSGILAALAVLLILSGARRRLVAVVLLVVILAGGFALLARAGIAVPFVMLMACVIGALSAVEASEMRASLRESRVSLEQIATRLAEQRAREVESKRVLAHELKTPIASLRGLTQLLAGYELNDAERRRVASLVESEAGKLQSMIAGLLDLERLPLRDFEATTAVIDLGSLVAARVAFLQASTERPLMTSIEHVGVRADASLLERVIDNLVGNALKYAPGSPVKISVRSDGGNAVLEVEDEGAGISAADRARIFDRFFRGSSAAGTEGLGLGLALVGETARWHGGVVTVHEGARGGALFRIVLPVAQAAMKTGAV